MKTITPLVLVSLVVILQGCAVTILPPTAKGLLVGKPVDFNPVPRCQDSPPRDLGYGVQGFVRQCVYDERDWVRDGEVIYQCVLTTTWEFHPNLNSYRYRGTQPYIKNRFESKNCQRKYNY